MRNAGLEETQAGITIARRNINSLRYADDTTLMAESEEELKSLLMKVKEESERCRWTSSCFHVLAIINSAVINIGVHVSLSICCLGWS